MDFDKHVHIFPAVCPQGVRSLHERLEHAGIPAVDVQDKFGAGKGQFVGCYYLQNCFFDNLKAVLLRLKVTYFEADFNWLSKVDGEGNVVQPSERDKLMQILRENLIANNVRCGWQDVPANAQIVLTKNKAVKEIARMKMQARKERVREYNVGRSDRERKLTYDSVAVDFVEKQPSQWGPPDKPSKTDLNKLLEEPEVLFLTEGGVYRFTRNDCLGRSPRFTHGQLCVVKRIVIPGKCTALVVVTTLFVDGIMSRMIWCMWKGRGPKIFFFITRSAAGATVRAEVWIAPAGERGVREDMQPTGWPTMMLDVMSTEKVVVGPRAKKGYRKQLPLAPFGTITVHKAMGSTYDMVAICIESDSTSPFHIWSHPLLLVQLSRVRSFKDIIIVGYVSLVEAQFTFLSFPYSSKWSDVEISSSPNDMF